MKGQMHEREMASHVVLEQANTDIQEMAHTVQQLKSQLGRARSQQVGQCPLHPPIWRACGPGACLCVTLSVPVHISVLELGRAQRG